MSSPSTHEPVADQALADFVRSIAAMPLLSASGDVGEMRRAGEARAAQRPPGPAMPTVDVELGRVYTPSQRASNVIVYLHGGGWTIGSVNTHDRLCRRLAASTDARVLSVEYRLAPEHPAPAAIEDAVAALEWVASGPAELGGARRAVAIAGDSAGGTVAALAALQLRGTRAAPGVLALAYANVHLGATGGSMDSNAHGFGLDADDVAWFNACWVPDRKRHSVPAFSPLLVEDLRGLPETIVISCELDPLRDQDEAFGARLVAAGVPVRMRRELGMVHNFLLWDTVSPACARAADRVAADIVRAFA